MRSQLRTLARYTGNWGRDLSVALPWRWTTQLGSGLGYVLYHAARDRRYVVRRNGEFFFPELSTEDAPDQNPELRTAHIGRMPWLTNKEKKAFAKHLKKAAREKGTDDAS